MVAVFDFENKLSERNNADNELWRASGCNWAWHKCGTYGRLDVIYILDGCTDVERAMEICRNNGGTRITPVNNNDVHL